MEKPALPKDDYQWMKLKRAYKWEDTTSPHKFINALLSNTTLASIEECNQRVEAGLIESSGKLLQEIFQKAADESLELKPETKRRPSKNKNKNKKQKRWFDKDCADMKALAKRIANLKHRNPHDNQLRQLHRHVMKQYKDTCRSRKENFWKGEYNNLNHIEAINFWEKWKHFGEDIPSKNTVNLDGVKCEDHFKSLFSKIEADINPVLNKIDQPTNQFLNREITMDELKGIIKRLPYKKAVGTDRIANELLKLATPPLLQALLNYLNLNLKVGNTCSNWCFGLIALIHKEGSKDDPNNYRGICVLNALLKVLCTILNDRLIKYCDDHHLINSEQIGFKKNSRTSDHIFTLKTLVNKYVVDQRNGKKLYACFVDFQKAFDSVWHDALFRKLENKGINGNFLEVIKNIYSNTQCAVKINGKSTKYFPYKKGVQPTEPTPF